MLAKKEEIKLKKKANQIRQDIISMIYHAESGHPAGSLGMTDVLTYLYFKFLKTYPGEPSNHKRDYLILSNGHICPAIYATLAHKGFFKMKELLTLRKLGSRLQGHPHRTQLPGLETSSGPLGSGLSQACGIALSLKQENKKNQVVVLTSDGEHEEGNQWEAIMLANKYKLDNIIQIMDRNHIQIDGTTDEIMPLKNLKEKYESFGWHVQEINGHKFKEIHNALELAKNLKGQPKIIIANTTPGKGVRFMENTNKWHGKAPNHEETHQAIQELKKEYEKIK
ncbi:transketolase [Candidatus Woesearchaeota archaeon]|nr:transketolase [Candidatus Woesearchaeota archaeon]MCF7901442.1 transketolase [Candidatus Woesearchaeota archaeon]MCF8013012.1 transketolase [Candidatus Woesearchaeota archaeon]